MANCAKNSFWQRFSLRLFLFPFLLVSQFAHAEIKGPSYVQKVLPSLYQTVEDSLGKVRADQIFKEWTASETTLFLEKLEGFFRELGKKELSAADHQSLYIKYQSLIVGTLGEAYGLSKLRAKYSENERVKLIDDIEYAASNNQRFENNRRPDGLVYEIRGTKLLIHEILESKIVGHLDSSQITGWLNRWKTRGIMIGETHFSPGQIEILAGEEVIPIEQWNPRSIKRKVFLVTSTGTLDESKGISIGISREERKSLVAGLISAGDSEAHAALLTFTARKKEAIIKKMIARFNSGNVTFPSTNSEGADKYLAIGIKSRFGTVVDLYNALPKQYQKKLRDAGFDPGNPIGSSKVLKGSAAWSKNKILSTIKKRLDSGNITIPTVAEQQEGDAKLAVAIQNHFGGIVKLFHALPRKYRKILLDVGFDPTDPTNSSKRLNGNKVWSKERVILEMIRRFDSGNITFPSVENPGQNGSLARAIQKYFGGLAELYSALPPKYQKTLLDAGFDPKNPSGSSRRMNGNAAWSKERILSEMRKRFDAGNFTIPSRSKSPELANAIQTHLGGIMALYNALSHEYQRKFRDAGFDPKNPRGSLQRMNGTAVWSPKAILFEIQKRFDSGNVTVPSQRANGFERKLATSIQWHFGGLANLFDALPAKYQKIFRDGGFDPSNPHSSSRRIRATAADSCAEAISTLAKKQATAKVHSFATFATAGQDFVLPIAQRAHNSFKKK